MFVLHNYCEIIINKLLNPTLDKGRNYELDYVRRQKQSTQERDTFLCGDLSFPRTSLSPRHQALQPPRKDESTCKLKAAGI